MLYFVVRVDRRPFTFTQLHANQEEATTEATRLAFKENGAFAVGELVKIIRPPQVPPDIIPLGHHTSLDTALGRDKVAAECPI